MGERCCAAATACIVAGAALAGFGVLFAAVKAKRSQASTSRSRSRSRQISDPHVARADGDRLVARLPAAEPHHSAAGHGHDVRHGPAHRGASSCWHGARAASRPSSRASSSGRGRCPSRSASCSRRWAARAFPSGHVLTYVGTYGFMAFLVYSVIRPPHRSLAAVTADCSGMVGLVGPSRIYEGHHWPTDVAASYLLGTAY